MVQGRGAGRGRRARPGAQRVPHRRRVRLAALRLRRAARPGHAARSPTSGLGVLVYLRGHEGRGIGIGHKIRAYSAAGPGPRHRRRQPRARPAGRQPRVRHRRADPGRPRHHHDAAASPTTRPSTAASRASASRSSSGCPSSRAPNPENIAYLRTKRERMGHLLEGLDDLDRDGAADPRARTSTSGEARGDGWPVTTSASVTGPARRHRPARRRRLRPVQRPHHQPPARRARARARRARRAPRPTSPSRGCPGAFEIPLAAKALADVGRVDAVISLGAVIRGDTAHFEFVAGECAAGIQQAAARRPACPIVFGVLTTENLDQALARSERRRRHNEGEERRRTSPSRWPASSRQRSASGRGSGQHACRSPT